MSKKLSYVIVLLVLVLIVLTTYPALAKKGQKGNDRILSKITFIHYKKGHAKPPWAGGGKKDDTQNDGIYAYIAKGARWKATEPIFLNPLCNDPSAGQSLVISAASAGMSEWEAYAPFDIFGALTVTENVDYNGQTEYVAYNDGAFREYNTISFGSWNNSDVIAITTVWGYFTGRPASREIVEAHMLMNDDYIWGDSTPTMMDLQNIFTHELGHWAGMGDLYEVAAVEETMYGYSENGETKKRDLYNGDITGIAELYK